MTPHQLKHFAIVLIFCGALMIGVAGLSLWLTTEITVPSSPDASPQWGYTKFTLRLYEVILAAGVVNLAVGIHMYGKQRRKCRDE